MVAGEWSTTAQPVAAVREAAVAIVHSCAERLICDQLIKLLLASGRLSVDDGHSRPLRILDATFARFMAFAEGAMCAVLAQSIDDDEEHLEQIRRFFLRPQETYSVEELAALWKVHSDDVRDIYHDELMRRAASAGERADEPVIVRADAVAASINFSILRPLDVERALGAEFSHARPEAWRTVPILVHVPRFIAEAIADDPSIPPKLPVDVRLEQIILEVFASGEHAVRTQRCDPVAHPQPRLAG